MASSKESRVIKRSKKPKDLLTERLKKLLIGKPVELISTYVDVTAKERISLILVTPGILYGMLPGMVVVSIIDKGSCVIDTTNSKGLYKLTLAGLPTQMAKRLFQSLCKIGELYAQQSPNKTERTEIVLQRARRYGKIKTSTHSAGCRKRGKKKHKE